MLLVYFTFLAKYGIAVDLPVVKFVWIVFRAFQSTSCLISEIQFSLRFLRTSFHFSSREMKKYEYVN